MKTVIIGGVAAGMSAASKLKRLLGDAVEIVVTRKAERYPLAPVVSRFIFPIILSRGRN